MTQGFVGNLTIFVLALLVGFEVISKVPATLHTPLMSGANSIHGVVLVGVVILASFVDGPLGYVLTFIAAAFGAANVVGGYAVTDRMLQMFRKRPVPGSSPKAVGAGAGAKTGESACVWIPASGSPRCSARCASCSACT
ncbi:MAG TPA: NAD(P) transhydrogenase subunit alpha [Jatrophihabitans sp.]